MREFPWVQGPIELNHMDVAEDTDASSMWLLRRGVLGERGIPGARGNSLVLFSLLISPSFFSYLPSRTGCPCLRSSS